jgi:exodeoxyribonuclease-5
MPSDQVVITGDLIGEYVRNYRADPLANHRMLLFRRQEVVDANNAIRARLFGENARVVEDGERIMILRTSDYPYKEDPQPGDTTRFYSGQKYHVDGVSTEDYAITINRETFVISHYVARIKHQDVCIVFAVSENQPDTAKPGAVEYKAAIAAAVALGRENDNWQPWKRLMSDFVHVAYHYATSVHRAQGQTADYAYVVPRPLLSVPGIMGPALSYVALTRAKKKLTVKV